MTSSIIRLFKLAMALHKRLWNVLSTKLAEVGSLRYVRLRHSPCLDGRRRH